MATVVKQGHHKKYGNKLSNPRIKASKEHRRCGPLAVWLAKREAENAYVNVQSEGNYQRMKAAQKRYAHKRHIWVMV